MTTIVVLGSAGYLGGNLCRFFHAMPGCRVVAVSRREPAHGAFDAHIAADVILDSWAARIPPAEDLVLINCAFDFGAIEKTGQAARYAIFEANIAALCKRGRTRLINVSSMSAYHGCRSDYGQEKLYLEALFARYGAVNIRPGLIVSWRAPGTAFLNLVNSVRGWKIIPIPWARNSGFFLCDIEAVVLGVYLLTRMRLDKPHLLSFCYRERLKLAAVLRLIERRYGVSRPVLAIPWRFPYLLLRVAEALLGKRKVRADSIVDFAFPATVAVGRDFFARLTRAFRKELEAAARLDGSDGALCLLEPAPAGEGCRSKQELAGDALRALGRLADA